MRRKVNGQSSSTTASATRSSGISEVNSLPKVLPYCKLLSHQSHSNHVKDLFCYIIKHYGDSGLSVLIYRQRDKDQVVVICGDWAGNNIDLTDDSELAKIAIKFNDLHLHLFLSTMRLIKLDQMQLFFSIANGELVLVDIQTAINKLSGPGMVRDVFGNRFPTQEVMKIELLDERAMQYLADGGGSYAGDLIIKPSRFRLYHDVNADIYRPLYVEVRR